MNKFKIAFLVSAAAIIVASSQCRADESMASDKQYAALAVSNNMLEIRLGQYLSDRGASVDVKRFAEQMINDHQRAKELLEKIASEKAIELPRVLNDQDKKALERLEKLGGPELDQAYVKQTVADHETAVKATEEESRSGKIVEMRFFAAKILPILQDHLKIAKGLASG
jgi:putative membrane protein